MLVADSNDKSATFKVAFLTGASIFVMGYMNAMSLNTYDLGTMLTPQTGNIIWMGINAATGSWLYFFENMMLFFGFTTGAVFALFTQNSFKNKSKQFYYNWTVFVLPVLLYPLILQYIVPPFVSFFVLGFAAGAALGFFRKMYHMEINNAMATGNARFVGIHFAQAFLKKDTKGNKKEIMTFWIFVVCVFLFAFGAYLYTVFALIDFRNGTDIYIGLGRGLEVDRAFIGANLGRLGSGYDRLNFGPEYGRVPLSNLARMVGLFVFCVVPYFFCPKPTIGAGETSA